MIRPFEPEDAVAVAALLHENDPPEALTPAGIVHWIAGQPTRARAASWVAVQDDDVVGWARAGLRWATSAEGVGEVWGFVRPEGRGRGLGGLLYERALAHLREVDARTLESWATVEEGGCFLLHRGFRPGRRGELLALDVAAADLSERERLEAVKQAEGFRLVPLSTVADRPEALHTLDAEAIADIPETFAEDDVRLEDWLLEALGHPQLTRDGSFVILAGERPVAHAFLHLDEEHRLAANEMTGTAREFRRRGLARLAKLATIRWAREHGIRTLRTETDEENAGMRRLNASLGYRRIGTETEFLRDGVG
jgi:GNAT superfamily N-acetyltransferase